MFEIDYTQFETLQNAMKAYAGNTEETVNEVLHNEAGQLIHDEIKRIMPVSGRRFRGKKPAAKSAESLRAAEGHLSITVKTTKHYQYLYFPDDGTNTRHHVGNQQFFLRAGEAKTQEIVDRCINRLVNGLNGRS